MDVDHRCESFQDAKTDDCARRSYKMLVALHSDCESIYRTVEEIGGIFREIRELEDQVNGSKKIFSSFSRRVFLV